MTDILAMQRSFEHALRASADGIDWCPSPAVSSAGAAASTPPSTPVASVASSWPSLRLPRCQLSIASTSAHPVYKGTHWNVFSSFFGSIGSVPLVQLRTLAVSSSGTSLEVRAAAHDLRSLAAADVTWRYRWFSHFCRYDRVNLTNYVVANLHQGRWVQRVRVGSGLVLKSDFSPALNLLWGFCAEFMRCLVMVHVDMLRRCCVLFRCTNCLGAELSMRLRINAITLHRTILDVGVAVPLGSAVGRWWARGSINMHGLALGASMEPVHAPLLLERAALRAPAFLQRWLALASESSPLQAAHVGWAVGALVRHPRLSLSSNPFSNYMLYTSDNSNLAIASRPEAASRGLGGATIFAVVNIV